VNRLAKRLPALAALFLGACTGSLFQTKASPPVIYMLSTAEAGPAAGTPAAALAVDLAILKPTLRAGLETDRIAALYADRRLDYFAAARWSGPLGEVLQDLAVQEFHSRANLRTVSGDASVFASAYWLEIEVTEFQADYTSVAAPPTVHVHILARLGSSGDRHILGQFIANAREPAGENRMGSIVDAYARAADAAMAQIVAQAAGALARISEAR
jgi:cholesterol transport system auxiliary component